MWSDEALGKESVGEDGWCLSDIHVLAFGYECGEVVAGAAGYSDRASKGVRRWRTHMRRQHMNSGCSVGAAGATRQTKERVAWTDFGGARTWMTTVAGPVMPRSLMDCVGPKSKDVKYSVTYVRRDECG